MKETGTKRPLACVILAAGQGTRMKSARPKVLHEVSCKPMIGHVTDACRALGAQRVVVVIAPGMDDVRAAVAPHECAVQEKPLGTGNAVRAARSALADFAGDILILFGDTPLVRPWVLEKFLNTGAALVVGGFTPRDPGAYGRIVLSADGTPQKIVEAADASPEEKAIRLCNGGVMLFDAKELWALVDSLNNANAKQEYYLTDCVALAAQKGLKIMTAPLEENDVLGVNDRTQLAEAEKIMQDKLRQAAMLAGVTMRAPETVYLCADTVIGRDTVIEPHVVFGPGVRVGEGAHIKSFSHLEGAIIESGAIIGPFARLRPGAAIGEGAHIGNFVEIKKAIIGAGAKANHLTYIGDATVGAGTNVGAGTITCNYDGFGKYQTTIGENVFVGSNTALVAPVNVGDGAIIAAGSVITKDIPPDAIALTRTPQENKDGAAARFRRVQSAKK